MSPTRPPLPRGPEVSVVVPVYRNRDTLVPLLDRLDEALGGENAEYVLVVDGSPDGSLELLLAELERRPRLRVLELAQNFGQHAALCAGFEAAHGRVVLVLDADLQQRPEDLPRFLARWRAGHDFVSGLRTRRVDPLTRRLCSFLLNRLVLWKVRVPLRDWGCPMAAIDRSILDRLPEHGEQRRFLKPLVAKLARDPVEVEIEGLERQGVSGYSLLALVGLALDFAVSFSDRPFQRLAGGGFLLSAMGLLCALAYIVARLLGMDPVPQAQAAIFVSVLLGVQLIVLGALGEFTHRIYRLVQGRPLFVVRAEHGGVPRRSAARGAREVPSS